MNFLADECVDVHLVNYLRENEHDVLYVMESMRGETDDVILARAFREQRILLTEDKDFGELVYRLWLPAVCVILLRFNPLDDNDQKVGCLHTLLSDEALKYEGKFIVVTNEKIRVRSLAI